MTREEALQILDTIPTIGEQVDALELAIEALSAEPCEDCISRKAVLDMVEDMTDQFGANHRVVTEGIISMLPPVTPKPKTDVLDKIRAEIEFIPTIEWKDDGTTYILASYFKKQVLEIIDKYKAESEEV